MDEAFVLLHKSFFGGGVYLAGRGVEGMLRGVIWRHDTEIRGGRQSLETGHDLRNLATVVRDLGLLGRHRRDDAFEAAIQKVAREWHNDMRYFPAKSIETFWWNIGVVHKGRTMKQAPQIFYEACMTVIRRSEALCEI